MTSWNVILCFFFNDTATTEIYTLSLHDALPICSIVDADEWRWVEERATGGFNHLLLATAVPVLPGPGMHHLQVDRKSTRLNSSHANISYAVFCLKKKKLKKSSLSFMILRLQVVS